MGVKLKRWGAEHPETYFHCPGCKCLHSFNTEPGSPFTKDPSTKWTWNGSMERPTVRNSINYPKPPHRCHFHLTDGRIEFCGDCDHELAGQAVELPDWED